MRGFSDDPIEDRDGFDLPPCIDCDTPTVGHHPTLIGEAQCEDCQALDAEDRACRLSGQVDYDAPTVAERDDAAHDAHRRGRS